MQPTSSSSLTPIQAALDDLLKNLVAIEQQESVALLAASNRILAEDCRADIDVPAYDNSAMDGYAVRTADLGASTNILQVSQRIAAGQIGEVLSSGQAARIFTGAPLPPGADAVVMQENCERQGDRVTILKPAVSGENLRRAGEDVSYGELLLRAGLRLRPQHIGVLASIGATEVQVSRKLKVAVMTTGDELVPPGTKLLPGQIYNSNFFALSALLESLGVEVIDLGVIEDDLQSTRNALESAAHSADCIISTGGVSVGEEDHVRAAVEAEGYLELWKLAIKPGKPFASGKVHDTQFFGLPGNPVSAFVTFGLLVRPSLFTMLGCSEPFCQSFQLRAGFDSVKSGERQQYLRASLKKDAKGAQQLLPYSNQSSGVGSSLSGADGLAIIPPYTAVAIGDTLEYIPFSELLS
jgi:molybdopterin molybdotransferase